MQVEYLPTTSWKVFDLFMNTTKVDLCKPVNVLIIPAANYFVIQGLPYEFFFRVPDAFVHDNLSQPGTEQVRFPQLIQAAEGNYE